MLWLRQGCLLHGQAVALAPRVEMFVLFIYDRAHSALLKGKRQGNSAHSASSNHYERTLVIQVSRRMTLLPLVHTNHFKNSDSRGDTGLFRRQNSQTWATRQRGYNVIRQQQITGNAELKGSLQTQTNIKMLTSPLQSSQIPNRDWDAVTGTSCWFSCVGPSATARNARIKTRANEVGIT